MSLWIFRRFFTIPTILIVLIASGCASSKDTLQLENIVEAEVQRKARLADEAAKEQAALEMKAKAAEEAAKLDTSPNAGKTPQEIIAKAKARPEELEFLDIPESMVRFTAEELAKPDIENKLRQVFPDLVAGWHIQHSSVMLLSGMVPMQPGQLVSMTKSQFLESVQKVKTKYEYFYKKRYNAPLTFKIMEKGSIIYVKMTSKYLDGGAWWTDERLIYFYKPEYRLNLLFTGKEEDFKKSEEAIEKSISLFESRLVEYYKGGIRFRQ